MFAFCIRAAFLIYLDRLNAAQGVPGVLGLTRIRGPIRVK
jgi:hypothetical protein